MRRKIIACFFIFVLIFSTNVKVMAAINQSYGQITTVDSSDSDEIGSSSIVLNWIGELAYYFAEGVQTIGAKIVKVFTGVEKFPWADKIIFNTIPVLDINFINPANGSLFKDVDGNETKLGEVIRNTYFTILSIAIGFLGIIIGVVMIRMLVTSIASQKAKYKESIIDCLKCLVLLFGLHYLLSFTFYLNEKMVEVASTILNEYLTSEADDTVVKIGELSDKKNKDIVEAFIKVATDNCFISDIPLVGDLYQGVLDFFHAVGRFFSGLWESIKGIFSEQSEEATVSKDQLGTIYPNKDDYVNYLRANDTRINVAAYLLKNKYYRSTYLQWIKGNDTNSITNSGVEGLARNILITANDVVGVADNGYKGLRTLFTSVALVTFQDGETSGSGKKVPFDSTAQEVKNKNKESYEKMSQEDKDAIDAEAKKNELSENMYYSDKIKSKSDYLKYIDNIDNQLSKVANEPQSDIKESKVLAYNLDKIYAEAYYAYVYSGSDKEVAKSSDLISELGEYFRSTSWYIDTDKGDWAPTSINVVSAICYGIFVIQSLLFLIAYFKRFFYVIILSMFGPIVVVFDYLSKSI